jgi:hypothetical protein
MVTPAKKSSGAPIKPRIRFIRPDEPQGVSKPTGKEKPADELRFGFWDNLIELLVIPTPGGGSMRLLNDEAETKNFVGGDSRRFYIVLEDPGAAGKRSVDVDWWTAYSNSDARVTGTVYDDPGSKLTLLETGNATGVFVSKGLMLVNDEVDRQVVTHSGISPSDPLLGKLHGGPRKDTMSNFRIRRIGLFGFSVASYQSKAMKAPVTTVAPVFSPASRKLMPVQVYVVRTSKGGPPAIPPADLAKTDLRVLTETYERHGIWVWTMVSPPDKLVAGTTERKVGSPIEYTILEVDPPPKVRNAKVTESDIDELARVFPSSGGNTLRLFFVEEILYKVNGHQVLGISYAPGYRPEPDESVITVVRPVPPTTLGTSAVRAGRDPYTAAHELGHCLMPKNANNGHYTTPSDVSKPGARHIDLMDLMFNHSRGNTENFFQTKRIWDLSDGDGDQQLLSLGLSPFLR